MTVEHFDDDDVGKVADLAVTHLLRLTSATALLLLRSVEKKIVTIAPISKSHERVLSMLCSRLSVSQSGVFLEVAPH